MNYKKIEWPELSALANISVFSSQEGVSEYHAMIQLTDRRCKTKQQYDQIEAAVQLLLNELSDAEVVWKRYFVSDAINQSCYIGFNQSDIAISIVQQPPLNGTKVAVWLYLASKVSLLKDKQGTVMIHSSYRHFFHTQLHSLVEDEACQTVDVFNQYVQMLASNNCTLEKHCVRTWVYVQGVDTHYAGMVAARRACFEQEGLTSKTHFIASTGIEGKYIRSEALVLMDAYAVWGLQPAQIQYLYATTHLNPTYEYGVTFERGTVVHYGDRRHIFISGTASINNRGEIEHPMNILKQTNRMFENIQTLLTEAEAEMEDVAHLIVYLRDMADYDVVFSYLEQNYPQIPKVILWAPVCRPGWLIEAECMAIKVIKNEIFASF